MVTLAATDSKYNTRLSTEIANIRIDGFDTEDAMMAWFDGAYDEVVKLEEDADKLVAALTELDKTQRALDKSLVAGKD